MTRGKKNIVTLLTDFGLKDEYVGVMKGVIATYAPDARIIDISHLIPPQEVTAAAHLLARTYPYFPPETVHMVVVDPGVGSSRAILAVAADGQYFVGPDNGVFTPVFQGATSLVVHRVTASRLFLDRVANTFHGRDIMAPIAGRLAAGLEVARVGPAVAVQQCVHLQQHQPIRRGELLCGHIQHVDRFGNLCTNISRSAAENFAAGREVAVGIGDGIIVPFCHAYADLPAGELLALYDSHDQLEIAVNRGDAARRLNLAAGAPVCLVPREHQLGDQQTPSGKKREE